MPFAAPIFTKLAVDWR